ncbi:extracellular metalloproteinase MEP [Ceratobasidium sp. AG-Ba]|nr:extracellular metalloproteinase MEP [Ceratobasidium sp. AG-Ba]
MLSCALLLLVTACVEGVATVASGATRKSLSFKQPLPNSRFTIDPPPFLEYGSQNPLPDSKVVARGFIEKHVLDNSFDYYIRNDSYTDLNTGVSHIYARQVVDGIEVADGDMNLNVRDGRVLSYGSSVFMGKLPEDILTHAGWSQEHYCSDIPAGRDSFACDVSLGRIHAAIAAHPHSTDLNPTAAAYFFIVAGNSDFSPLNHTLDQVIATPNTCQDAVSTSCWRVSTLPGVLSPIDARLVYTQTHAPGSSHTQLNLAWRLEVRMEDNWYEAYVSAHDPSKIIAVGDWVKDGPMLREDGWPSALQAKVFGQTALGPEQFPVKMDVPQTSNSQPVLTPVPVGTYNVWKWGINDPVSGIRTLESPLYNKEASPLGWHSVLASRDPIISHPDPKSDDIVNYTTTVGNNVIAQSNWAGGQDWKNNSRPDGGPCLVFDFPYDGTQNPRQNVNTSVTQLFYLSNMYHDLMYLYGFDERSGNFQQYNFGKGGVDGDGVVMYAQDGGGFNNAYFLTPPDGQNGQGRMFIWNTASPARDGALDAGIVIHELTHGLSTRLTGGPKNSGCLDYTAFLAAGMGEGWSDFVATLVRSTSTYSDYPIGAWVANKAVGIRHFPYAINVSVNPFMYNYLQQPLYLELHAIGEIWAEALWVVTNVLIDAYGFADSLFRISDSEFYRTVILEDGASRMVPKHGNTLILQSVLKSSDIFILKP